MLAAGAGHRRRARPISARAARTTPRPWCPRARAPMPASAATTWSQWMDRDTDGFTQMGGEGANWVGEAPFSTRGHVFQNLGDGTYNHSGVAGAALGRRIPGTNVTYKMLFNDAVAMTGGQRHEGGLTVDQIARQVARRRRRAHRRRHRRARQISAPARTGRRARRSITATISTPCSASCATVPGVTRADLRPDLRHREAPPPQARRLSRSRQARHHQRARLRGLRRLRRAVELRLGAAARDRVRPQAPDRPVELQQGFFLRQGLLPVLRHGAWRASRRRPQPRELDAAAPRRRRSARARACRRSTQQPSRSSSPASAAPASSRSARSSAWRRISRARAAA